LILHHNPYHIILNIQHINIIMSLRSVILATATLCAYVADAHMIMKSPVPYSVDKLDNGPINKLQFPCKNNLGYTVSTMNAMAVGEEQTLSFTGSAVHGGGSCQLSVTTDTEPSASSKFKVIKSVEGGCPGVDGPTDFKFTLPDSIPNGKATFAWTWFAKLSGGPEMYMNCAPIEVTGGASDTTAFDALPDMLVANIESTTCKSVTSEALKFPNPGTVLASGDDGSDVKPPTGDCGATGTSPDPSSPAGSGAPVSSAAGGEASAAPSATGGNDGMYTPPAGAASSAVATAAPSAAVPTSAAGGYGSAAPTAASSAAVTSAAASSGAGGVFAPGASSAAPVASTQTTLVTVTGTPAAPAQSTAAASAPAAGTGTTPTKSAAAPAAPAASAPAASGDGTCTTDGAIVCNGTTQFGLCNQGKVVWQAVAAGTTCSNGTIQKRGYNGRVVRRNRGLVGHVHKH
jgi:hypothetical protein